MLGGSCWFRPGSSRTASHGKPRASPSTGMSQCGRSCRRGTAARPGSAFTFLLRAHLSAELSAAPVIGPQRSLVLGVNTAESGKTRAEPGAPSKAAEHQHAHGRGDAHPPLCIPSLNPRTPPREGCSEAVVLLGITRIQGCSWLPLEWSTGDLG